MISHDGSMLNQCQSICWEIYSTCNNIGSSYVYLQGNTVHEKYLINVGSVSNVPAGESYCSKKKSMTFKIQNIPTWL